RRHRLHDGNGQHVAEGGKHEQIGLFVERHQTWRVRPESMVHPDVREPVGHHGVARDDVELAIGGQAVAKGPEKDFAALALKLPPDKKPTQSPAIGARLAIEVPPDHIDAGWNDDNLAAAHAVVANERILAPVIPRDELARLPKRPPVQRVLDSFDPAEAAWRV